MNFDPNSIIRSNISNLKAYTPIVPFDILSQQLGREPEEIIKLDANENPYGPSPLVAEALAEFRKAESCGQPWPIIPAWRSNICWLAMALMN
jgi:histidinol-phosphate aminotransferase